MTEEWPVCPHCGKRHPSHEDIYEALRTNSFADEDPETYMYSPPEIQLIIRGCEETMRTYPMLNDNVRTLLTKVERVLYNHGDLGIFDDTRPRQSLPFTLETSERALIIFVLEELIHHESEFADNASALIQKQSVSE